jgi:AraC family transcriptional regulator, glycine betaine-responsive activator
LNQIKLMVYERIRSGEERQRMPLRLRLGSEQPRLTAAVALMEANLEEPLDVEELARLVGVSRRHLERLFHDHLGTTLTRYYLRLRLEQGRRLLRQSERPITEIALACGFVSVSHFSTRYRELFGYPPRRERTSHLREFAS